MSSRAQPQARGTVCFAGGLGTVVALGLLWAGPAAAQSEATIALQACESFQGLVVSPATIGLPTQGATVLVAERVAAQPRTVAENGEIILPLPAHCRLAGEIASIDEQAPEIQFNINLPLAWNGRAMQSGGGGLGGTVNTAPGQKASGRWDPQPFTEAYPLTRGWVTFGGDEGHRRGDISFIYNDEALRNWGGDALKKIHDVALPLIERAYGQSPDYVYFNGESAGGKEALYVAQRHAADYDGIMAVSPVLSWTYIHIADNYIRSRLVDNWLDADDIGLIADATRDACDADDGLADGILARYLDCDMNPYDLVCPGGETGAGCLSTGQVRTLNAIREPWVMGVPLAYGVNRFAGFGITGDEDGAENQYSFYMVGTEPPAHPMPAGRGFQPGLGAIMNFGAVWVRHVMAQDETFEPYDFYPPAYADRIQYISGLFDATNPDLSPLRARGGKLMILAHSADNAVSTGMIAEYYRSVVAEMGEAAADDVLRLYVGPGGAHNGTGVAQADTLSLLVDWVEQGDTPPVEIPIYDIDPTTHETRRGMVACAYPRYAHYDGSGDPDQPSSFSCRDRTDPLAYDSSAR
ncbi:MAG: tannase/feruloyl esterase family alpha/beta hydrolase [Gammaproteobacteria bacterium]|nr:tannase/feruloyl esterase family alpha/beta hydrolase [Gammaproteobacteria bacterium]